MKGKILLIGLLVLIIALSGCTQPSTPSGGTVSGNSFETLEGEVYTLKNKVAELETKVLQNKVNGEEEMRKMADDIYNLQSRANWVCLKEFGQSNEVYPNNDFETIYEHCNYLIYGVRNFN